MIVSMSEHATEAEINHVIERIEGCGYRAHVILGTERTVIGAVGSNGRRAELEALRAAPGVADVVPITHPFKLVSRQVKRDDSTSLGREEEPPGLVSRSAVGDRR